MKPRAKKDSAKKEPRSVGYHPLEDAM
jgi:hypothetical protein